MVSWDEKGSISVPETPPGVRSKVLVTHDESTFMANDGRRQVWQEKSKQLQRPKGRGKGIMVSDFLTPGGRLKLPDSVPDEGIHEMGLKGRYATVLHEYGKEKGYWTADHVVEQTIEKAIRIFEEAFPGYQAVFAFDNSTNHGAFAKDALVASNMNLRPGGKQPKMRDGFIHEKGCPQPMVFPDNHPEHPGLPKGMQQVLIERGKWRQGLQADCKKDQCSPSGGCCARKILAAERDFVEQKCRLQEEVERRGHIALFYPKFHCELNFIEMYWGNAKKHARDNCDYSFPGLRKTVPEALASVPNSSINRYFNLSLRIMEAYRDNVTYGTEEFTKRVYKSHRRIQDKTKW